VKLFLDSSVVLAACGRPSGASRAIFDFAAQNQWRLLTSRYVLNEVTKNLQKLPSRALADWPVLSAKLLKTRDVWTLDRPVVFEPAKDRPVLFTAAAWANMLLTLDVADFGKLIETGFYHLTVMSPGAFLARERAAGRLR
jgi:predicted nucleic acid-binding protein